MELHNEVSTSSVGLPLSVVTLKLVDVEVDGLDENSNGADGWFSFSAASLMCTTPPHPVVVEAVAVDAKEFVDECFERGCGVLDGFTRFVMVLFASFGLEAQSSSSKQMLQVAVGMIVYQFQIRKSNFTS